MFDLFRRRCAVLAAVMVLMAAPSFVFASGGLVPIVPQSNQGSGCNGPGGCQSVCDLAIFAQNILNDAIFGAVFLAAILFTYAGFKMLTSPANPGQLAKGKQLFYSVLIGFLIILGAWLIINAIMSVMVSGSAAFPWNKIC